MNSYIIDFFPEGSDTMESVFFTAKSVAAAKEKCADKYGAFINIMGVKLTQSMETEPEVINPEMEPEVEPVAISGTSIEEYSEPETTKVEVLANVVPVIKAKKEKVAKEPKEKKVKPEKVTKEKKVTNSSRVRERIVQAKAEGLVEADVIAWAMETLGQKKAIATAYVRYEWPRN